MKPIRYVSLERIIENVRRDFDIIDQISMSDIMEWVFYSMGLIGADIAFIQKVTDGNTSLGHPYPVKIEDYRGALPADIYKLTQVREYTSGQSMRASQGSFSMSVDNPYPQDESDYTYTINNSYIFTNFEEGYVEVSYVAFPTDSRGYPTIPDDVKYIKAVESYLIERLARREFLSGKLSGDKYRLLEQEWLWYCGAAKQSILSRSIDEMESMKNEMVRFVRRSNLHSSGYEAFGQKEYLTLGRRDNFVSVPEQGIRDGETTTYTVTWTDIKCNLVYESVVSVNWVEKSCELIDVIYTVNWENVKCSLDIESTISSEWLEMSCKLIET